MKLFKVLLVFLMSFVVIVCASDEKEDEEILSGIKDDWIDPHNMVDDTRDSETALRSAFSNIQDELRSCKKKLEASSSSSSKQAEDIPIETASCDTPYFKQLVRVIHEATSNLKPFTEINLSAEQREIFKKFLNDEANIHDVNTILLNSITNRTMSDSFIDKSKVFFQSVLNTEALIFVIFLTVLVMLFIIFQIKTRLTALQQLSFLLIMLFIISIPWEWCRLYKKEFAKKQGIMMETLQKHCKTDHELGPIESLNLLWKSSFSTDDSSCAKYQEALLVDAVWEVAPSMAVSVTITRFFVQPLEHIADAVGKSFRALFQHLPLQWQPLMFLACLVITILLLICVRGFHVSSPFLRFGVGGQPALNNEHLLRIEHQMQQMAENKNVPAIENVRNGDQAIIQAILDITRAMNERSQQHDTLLREIRNKVQDIRRHCRQEEAVEHPDWELVENNRAPIPVSDQHATENGPAV
ncbi:chloride channel CLIC-like protein 1 isoform X2 [Actinia tenebrosa]|uniref:Chloride channel CLIC-like protein 1 n=1 Tax=Actinia tenebrosa TaxID=6105 RepID=A0A6P8IHM0_ACTTE|nr:chloride channel CLIC-like protein 1 isoform X2 [Actinia tenebrosa]